MNLAAANLLRTLFVLFCARPVAKEDANRIIRLALPAHEAADRDRQHKEAPSTQRETNIKTHSKSLRERLRGQNNKFEVGV